MSKIFSIRAGDRRPFFAYKFPFSLETAVSVSFSARDVDAGVVFIDRQPAQIADGTYEVDGQSVTYTPADGVVFYPWAAGDTAVARKGCQALFHVTWPGNLEETLPSEGYERFVIADNF